MKFGFFLLGKKGFTVLESFLNSSNHQAIGFVIVSGDPNVDNDYCSEILALCLANNILCLERVNKPEGIEKTVDYTFAIGWRWIINSSDNLIVLHDSLLPKYRGFSPLVNMLINKECHIGVTALFASFEYDKGDIIDQVCQQVTYPIKISEAVEQISKLYAGLILKICKTLLTKKTLTRTKQNEKDASYSMWRDEIDYAIDWSKDSDYVERFINSVSSPFAGASSYIRNRKIRITEVEQIPDVIIENREIHIGKCIFMQKQKPVIICGEGLLLLRTAYWDEDNSLVFDSFNFRTRLSSTLQDI